MSLAVAAALLGACGAVAGSLALAGAGTAVVPVATGQRWGPLERIGAFASSRARARLEPQLRDARSDWRAATVVGVQRVAILGAIALAVIAPGPGSGLAIVLVVVSVRGPSIVMARLVRRRTAEAARELPLFLDLLAVATSAGLGPQVAVRRAVEPVEGPLAEELGRALRGADLGRRWRDELVGAGERLRLPDLDRAVRLLARTERLGSSLADEMARLASDVRDERRSRAVERARAAPVKMLFPLVFLILPAFLLLTVVPVLLTTVAQIG